MPMTDSDTLDRTLGQRLDALGRGIAARHLVTYPWAASLAPLLGRAGQRAELFHGRFERDESPAAGAGGIVRRASGHDSGQAPPGARTPAVDPAGAAPPARQLPFDVRSRLREVAGPGADALRAHTGPAADTFARSQGADAVTAGTDVYFRDGRYRPREPAGLELLSHEAAHVTALLDPGRAGRRATAGGAGAEEEAALGSERAARERFGPAGARPATAGPAGPWPLAGPGGSQPEPPGPPGPPGPSGAGLAGAAAAGPRPMRAPVDRDTGQGPPFDVEELRRSLVTDLMRQLRTEFERGG